MKSVQCIRLTIGLTLFLMSMIRATARGAEPIEVFVSIVPQKYFVERIGGESVKVSIMVQPGANSATYEPKPRQMVALSKAKAYFAIGVPFETVWLNRISAANSGMTVIHTEEGIEKRIMEDHLHGEEGYSAQEEEERTLDDLLASLKSKGKEVRIEAAEYLAECGPQAKEAIPALQSLLEDPDMGVRMTAEMAIEFIQREEEENDWDDEDE